MNVIQAIILAIIEGITEFLPVSSTGHMIIGSAIMGIASEPFVKMFTVAIQFGTILSVVVLYWRRFLQSFDFYVKLLVAFLPAVFFGLLLNDLIDQMLGSVVIVAVMLIIGGIIFLFVDDYFEKNEHTETSIDDISYPKALKIGLFQVLAMVPGVSRSASTIIGGLFQKVNRTTAAEFSFFLAVPTMFGATAKKIFDYINEGGSFTNHDLMLLGIGNLIGFLVAMVAIKSFITYLSKHGFRMFGYYRIVLGLIVLGFWAMGYFDNLELSNF